jgi:hypothetical protein
VTVIGGVIFIFVIPEWWHGCTKDAFRKSGGVVINLTTHNSCRFAIARKLARPLRYLARFG